MASIANIQKAYLAYFGRPVDFTGSISYQATTEAAMYAAFATSAESVALYGTTFGATQVNAIYLALFNRVAEPAGISYWVDQVVNRGVSPAGAAIAILNGAQNADAVAITNKLAASAAFTAALDTTPEIVGYSGDVAAAAARAFLSTITATAATQAAIDAAVVTATTGGGSGGVAGQTFTLTTGIDTYAGTIGDDTFTGTNATFTAVKSISGGTGIDTLKLVDVGTVAWTLPAATVTGVEKIVITNTNAGTAGVAAVPAIAEQQQIVLTGTATGAAAVGFLGVNTAAVAAAATAATVAAAIVTAKADILAGAVATAAGITNITAVGAVLTLTYGGAGGTGDVPILAAAAASNGITAGASAELVKGVAGVPLVAAGAAGTDTADARLFVGATSFASENSSAAVVFNNLSATQSLTVRGTAQSGNVTAAWLDVSTAPIITVDGGVNNTTISTASSTATTATINSTGAANGSVLLIADTFNLTAGATLTKLNINAATNLRAVLTAGNFAVAGADLVVTGAATNVNLGTAGVFKTVDASGMTAGGVTVNSQALMTSFVGGAGKDTLTGAAGVAPAATASIDGGAGTTDTVSATLINAGNSAVFKNWEIIDTAGMNGTLDASLLTASTISTIAFSGTHTAATISGLVETAAGLNLVVTGTTGAAATIGGTAGSVAGTSDIFNINFAATDKAAATTIAANTVTLSKFEILNIVSGGGVNTSNTITVTDVDAKTITITGAKDLTLVMTAQTAGVASANASQLTSIDGSAATGNLTITVPATDATVSQTALTIKGGSGNDIITVSTSALGSVVGAVASVGATVTLGAGNDTLNVALATQVSTTAPQSTTVTDFSKGDSLVFADSAGVEAFTATKLDITAATSLVTALAIANAGNATGAVKWFQYAGNTYVTEDVGAAAVNTTDIVVKLSGLVDLSTSTFAGQTLTFA